MESNTRAKPLANKALTKSIFELLQKASSFEKLKRGANESSKSLNRDHAQIVILAADACPLEIILHIPLLCEEKDVPFIFVKSKAELGEACNTTRDVISCTIVKNQYQDHKMKDEVKSMQIEIEKCFYQNQN